MREPIAGSDVRPGDTVECESHGMVTRLTVDHIDTGRIYAAPGNAEHDSSAFLWDNSGDWFLLDRTAPAVGLPTEPTLGWVTSKFGGAALGTWERYEGSVGSLAGEVSALVRERDVPIYDVTAFVEAVAVPKAALDELRRHDLEQAFTSDYDEMLRRRVLIETFLNAVDAANGADQ